MAAHNVVIFADKYSCEVRPPEQFAQRGETIKFGNATDSTVVITFLDGKSPFVDGGPITVDPEKYSIAHAVRPDALGSYPYFALCQSRDSLARGSVPRIIIYPTEA